ncbi:MAG: pro-sigmaK processing inhibitor BofA [Ruminococcaceae bacterium]|nr:pro-sigmaK processing inhibitor BofA [Oscillospiraceae bacterium]
MSTLELVAYGVAGILLLLMCFAFFKPLRAIFAMLLQAIGGGLGLYIFNLIFAKTGFFVGINIVTASICGVLGLPGFCLLLLGKMLYML